MHYKNNMTCGCAPINKMDDQPKATPLPLHPHPMHIPFNHQCCNKVVATPLHHNHCCAKPTVLKPICKVINEYEYHNIQHVQPIHTHVVKNHVNIHETVPKYTYSTEDKCCDKYK